MCIKLKYNGIVCLSCVLVVQVLSKSPGALLLLVFKQSVFVHFWIRNWPLFLAWQEYNFYLITSWGWHVSTQHNRKAADSLGNVTTPHSKVMNNNRNQRKHWQHCFFFFFPWSDFITKFMRTYSITREFANMRKENKAEHRSLTNR